MSKINPGFGDNVRIRATPLTEQLSLAGLVGNVHGETTPSVTGVKVIGEVTNDYALAVMIEGQDEALWFAPDLVEFVDHAPGTTMEIGGRRFIRDASGQWREA